MSMKVSSSDGVKVYHITSGKTLPQWLAEAKKKSLRKDDAYRRWAAPCNQFHVPCWWHMLRTLHACISRLATQP